MATTTMENFLMQETKKEEVMFTSDKIEASKNTRTVVRFSKPKPKKQEDSGTTTKDVLNYVDASMDIVKGCLKVGAFVVPEVAPALLCMAGVATFIQGALKFVPDDTPDPVDEKLKDLEKTIFELEKKMNAQFADLKSYVTEIEFTVEIISEASILMKYMRDVLKYRTQEAFTNFRDAYDQNSPLILAYTVGSLMDRKSTNPLRMEMDVQKAKSKTVFNKWEKCIGGLMAQLMFIEAFASGLLKDKNEYNWHRIVEQSDIIHKHVKQLKEEYLKDENYWADLKTFLEDFVPKSEHLNNFQKATEIAAKVDTYLTNDSFHVVVLNEVKWQEKYTYICPNEKDQIIGVWRKAKCSAFIYRSRKAYQMSKAEIEKTKQDVKDTQENGKNRIHLKLPLDGVLKQQLVDTKYVRGDGLVALLNSDCNPQILGVNLQGEQFGPGHLASIEVSHRIVTDAESGQYFKHTLLVSLP